VRETVTRKPVLAGGLNSPKLKLFPSPKISPSPFSSWSFCRSLPPAEFY